MSQGAFNGKVDLEREFAIIVGGLVIVIPNDEKQEALKYFEDILVKHQSSQEDIITIKLDQGLKKSFFDASKGKFYTNARTQTSNDHSKTSDSLGAATSSSMNQTDVSSTAAAAARASSNWSCSYVTMKELQNEINRTDFDYGNILIKFNHLIISQQADVEGQIMEEFCHMLPQFFLDCYKRAEFQTLASYKQTSEMRHLMMRGKAASGQKSDYLFLSLLLTPFFFPKKLSTRAGGKQFT